MRRLNQLGVAEGAGRKKLGDVYQGMCLNLNGQGDGRDEYISIHERAPRIPNIVGKSGWAHIAF